MALGNNIELAVQLPSLQFFALGNNNNLAVGRYEKQFKDLLTTVFNEKSYFADMSANGIEALDGIKESDTAFSVKTSDIAVTVGTYNTDANVAFGTGTANTSRFGNRTEIIYSNVDVPYSGTWTIHEGIDRFTVNNDFQRALADRLALNARAQAKVIDDATSAYLNTNAGTTLALTALDDAGVRALFDEASAHFINIEVDTTNVVAKVSPELYNAIVDGALATGAKASSVNIDANGITRFKGFIIEAVPSAKLSGNAAIFYPRGVGKVFTGIATTRTAEAMDFDGVVIQGAGKHGAYVPLDNQVAIVKVTPPTP